MSSAIANDCPIHTFPCQNSEKRDDCCTGDVLEVSAESAPAVSASLPSEPASVASPSSGVWYVSAVYGMSVLCMVCQCCVWYVSAVYDMSVMCMVCQCCAWYVSAVYGMSVLCCLISRS